MKAVLDYFNEFSQCLELEANLDICELCILGVFYLTKEKKSAIVGIPLGELPFRYLVVPLSSKKLTYGTCKPLLDKIIHRLHHWAAKSLSYDGRLCLIHSVLSSLCTFWAHIFILPKNLIKEID